MFGCSVSRWLDYRYRLRNTSRTKPPGPPRNKNPTRRPAKNAHQADDTSWQAYSESSTVQPLGQRGNASDRYLSAVWQVIFPHAPPSGASVARSLSFWISAETMFRIIA